MRNSVYGFTRNVWKCRPQLGDGTICVPMCQVVYNSKKSTLAGLLAIDCFILYLGLKIYNLKPLCSRKCTCFSPSLSKTRA